MDYGLRKLRWCVDLTVRNGGEKTHIERINVFCCDDTVAGLGFRCHSAVNPMPLPGVLPRDTSEIEKIRRCFIERPVQPTYEELVEEFAVPRATIGNWASKEGWVALRAGYMEQRAKETNALGILVEAAQRVNRPIILAITDAVLSALHGITQTIQDVDPKRAPSTRIQIYNTATFAIKNISDACKTIGLIGMPKGLADAGGDGRWNPQHLQQINLHVQTIIAEAEKSIGSKKEPAPTETEFS